MGLFPQQFIDDLRLQANILQVVQEYVPLKRAGTSYKGNCPFHNEKTPSFHVHPEKGFFHCFGCGVGGDVFKFLELHEKVGFQDAVRMLARKFGVALPEPAEGDGGDDARRDSALREGLLKAHEIAAEYFKEQLAAPVGGRARAQLAERAVAFVRRPRALQRYVLLHHRQDVGLHAQVVNKCLGEETHTEIWQLVGWRIGDFSHEITQSPILQLLL